MELQKKKKIKLEILIYKKPEALQVRHSGLS